MEVRAKDYAALRKRLAENIRDENGFLKFGLGVAPVGPLLDFVIAEVTEWEKERDSQPATELSDDEVERELSLISLATGSGD